jgi:hypothetical protein
MKQLHSKKQEHLPKDLKYSYADRVYRKFHDQYVTELDRALLNIVFHRSPTQSSLDEALKICDIEVLGAHKSLLLSYFMLEHPELKISAYAAPRLRGLVDFYRFANIKVLSHFSKIGKALNARNIPILLFKGAAMKYLRPELSRPMGDVDILIPPDHMGRAVKICKDLGYHDAMTGTPHALDIHSASDESAIDIHGAIMKDVAGDTFQRKLFDRAREVKAFGVRVFLPSHEDLFFIVLANLTKNLREKTSIHGLFYALLDAKFLLSGKAGFDWSIVGENIRATNTELPVRLGAEFMNRLAPDIIPDIDVHLPLSPKMEAYCNQIIFDEDYFNKRQAFCRNIRVVDLKNYPRHYGKIIFKFLLLKKLRNFPAFVRWYLKKH